MKAKIFRNLWRANAVLIFSVGVLAVILLVVAGVHMVMREFRYRSVDAVVNTDQKQKIDESLRLGSGQTISGQSWLMLPLESEQTYDQGSYSKSASAVRNYAFVSPTEPTHWLYPHNRFLILEAILLPGGSYNESEPTSFISFEVVEKDTNGDNRLTGSDSANLVFTRPDGSGQSVVLDDVQGSVSQRLIGEEILVIYRNSKGMARVVFSLKDFTRLREEKIEFPAGTGS